MCIRSKNVELVIEDQTKLHFDLSENNGLEMNYEIG